MVLLLALTLHRETLSRISYTEERLVLKGTLFSDRISLNEKIWINR